MGRGEQADFLVKASQLSRVYIYGLQDVKSVDVARKKVLYVCFSQGYPQKGVLIHSYEAVFHTRPRQILACL